MEENLHKDNLEEFFKNSFKDENIDSSDDQWDVPSDAVWSGINEKINPPAKSTPSAFNFKGLLAIAASILIVGLVYYNYTLQNQISDLSEVIENQKKTIDKLEKMVLEKGEMEEGNNGERSVGGSNLVENGKKEEGGRNTKFSNPLIDNSNSKNNYDSPQVSNSEVNSNENNFQKNVATDKVEGTKNPLNNLQPSDSTVEKSKTKKDIAAENSILGGSSIIIANDASGIKNTQSKSSTSEKSDQKLTDQNGSTHSENNIALLMPLPYKPIFLQANNVFDELTMELLPVSDDDFNSPELPKFKPGFYIGAHIAPTYSYRNIKSVDGPVLRRLLNEKEQAVYTVALGLKAGYQFSKNWSVETGLNYYKNTIRSMHLAQVQYQNQIEQLNSDGDYDSNYHLNLSTSYGEIETDIALTRSSDVPIDQNTYINLGFKTKQELKYLGVPLALRYRTAGNKFHFSAKAGISGNFILQKEVTIVAAQSNRMGVRHRRTLVDRKFNGLKNTTFDFLFGIGADYDISKNMSIYFEPMVTHSINPVYNLNGKIKTYPIVASLNLGLSYRF